MRLDLLVETVCSSKVALRSWLLSSIGLRLVAVGFDTEGKPFQIELFGVLARVLQYVVRGHPNPGEHRRHSSHWDFGLGKREDPNVNSNSPMRSIREAQPLRGGGRISALAGDHSKPEVSNVADISHLN
jgi:hypothetical protein